MVSVAMMPPLTALLLGVISLTTTIHGTEGAVEYYGKFLGHLSRLMHSVSGDVYAVDVRTLHIRDFTYDGAGPAAFFYAGNSKTVGPGGFRVRDETGSERVLKSYNKKHITVTLPDGKTLNNIKWFSVWCDEFQVNFGSIQIPPGLDYPKPQKIGHLAGVHAVSSENIVVVDAQTLLIPSFSYDGEAPDAKFWVGRGPNPSPQGIRIPDENGKITPLRKYVRKTIVLTLPGDLTVFDIGHFGVWCEAFTVDFGHIQIPSGLNVPPSLKMLGVSPQSKLNCEVLSDDLAYEVRWAIAGDSVVIQLVAKLEDGEYMSFGLSGEEDHSAMVGGDVVVAWVDQNSLNGYAHDYYLDAKSQCAGTRGSCPDYVIEPNTENVRLLNAALVNGYSIVTYQRPLKAHDGLDRPILTTKSQPVIWAVGPLNSKLEVSYHSVTSKGDVFLDFGRPPKWNCPIPESDHTAESSNVENISNLPVVSRKPQVTTEVASTYKTPPPPSPVPPLKNGAWVIPPIQCNEPDDGVFYAQMGPAGGKRGYPAITGHVGWGIAYYINGLLIPEIHVVRGKTYNFVVEGGTESSVPAKFHPMYITDDPIGGYQHKTPEERRKVNIYAGAELNKKGDVVPTGIGRLCNWTPDPNKPDAGDFASFGAYQRTLTLICDNGEPALIQWTPDKNTPDTVYYQCFSHRYLGWKIHVHDRCDLPPAAGSNPVPSIALPDDELVAKPSIMVTTRVKPDFPPQTIADTNLKNVTKNSFPYKIVKPAYNIKRPNMSDDYVIPVREDVEDIPETTTVKLTVQNVSMEIPHAMPLMKGPPVRNGLIRPVNRRPMIVVRRPVQQMMKPHSPHLGGRPIMMHHAASQARPVIIKKPVIRHPQRPVMMHPNHFQRPIIGAMPVVPQNPIMPPSRPMAPAQAPHPKPIYVHKFKKPLPSHVTPSPEKTKHKMHPSQMISQSAEDQTTRLPIAVNTGFNPGSLVIESGFKPIIQTPQAVAEERVSEVDYDDDGNEGVINVENTDGQKSQTEMFEPMFIPSPLDSNIKHIKKATTEPLKKIRKPYRPVVVRRPIYNDVPLFRSEPDDETPMGNENSKTFYVSPNHQPSYDGKQMTEETVPALPPNHKLNSRGSEQLEKTAQYVPFKGEDSPTTKHSENVPQSEEDSNPYALPLKSEDSKQRGNDTTTKLTSARQEPQPEAAEVEVVTASVIEEEDKELNESEKVENINREKRSARHEGHDHDHDHDHDHSMHDHSMHDHSAHEHMNQNKNYATTVIPFLSLYLLCLSLLKLC
ncbi:protein Skeletor, isoforms B/C [Cimex lectularius]|uniref:Protein Skeletor n=1 Tax=Cimex lectularius TaxID=79782 RepID=A0A8I6TBY8_CIMLE|nr:protein Skeletor, isoforms B/C [Cimex lectularius]